MRRVIRLSSKELGKLLIMNNTVCNLIDIPQWIRPILDGLQLPIIMDLPKSSNRKYLKDVIRTVVK